MAEISLMTVWRRFLNSARRGCEAVICIWIVKYKDSISWILFITEAFQFRNPGDKPQLFAISSCVFRVQSGVKFSWLPAFYPVWTWPVLVPPSVPVSGLPDPVSASVEITEVFTHWLCYVWTTYLMYVHIIQLMALHLWCYYKSCWSLLGSGLTTFLQLPWRRPVRLKHAGKVFKCITLVIERLLI